MKIKLSSIIGALMSFLSCCCCTSGKKTNRKCRPNKVGRYIDCDAFEPSSSNSQVNQKFENSDGSYTAYSATRDDIYSYSDLKSNELELIQVKRSDQAPQHLDLDQRKNDTEWTLATFLEAFPNNFPSNNKSIWAGHQRLYVTFISSPLNVILEEPEYDSSTSLNVEVASGFSLSFQSLYITHCNSFLHSDKSLKAANLLESASTSTEEILPNSLSVFPQKNNEKSTKKEHTYEKISSRANHIVASDDDKFSSKSIQCTEKGSAEIMLGYASMNEKNENLYTQLKSPNHTLDDESKEDFFARIHSNTSNDRCYKVNTEKKNNFIFERKVSEFLQRPKSGKLSYIHLSGTYESCTNSLLSKSGGGVYNPNDLTSISENETARCSNRLKDIKIPSEPLKKGKDREFEHDLLINVIKDKKKVEKEDHNTTAKIVSITIERCSNDVGTSDYTNRNLKNPNQRLIKNDLNQTKCFSPTSPHASTENIDEINFSLENRNSIQRTDRLFLNDTQITARLGKKSLSRVKSPIVTRRSNFEKSSYIYLSGTYESSTTSLSSRSNESFQPTLSKVFEKETAVWSRKSTDSAQISSFEKIQQPSNCLECNQSETNCKTTSINRVEKLQEEDQNNATTAANGKFQKRFNENESSIYYSTKNASVDPLTTSSIAMQEIIEEEEEEEEDTTFPQEREFKNDGFYEHTSIRENKTVTIQEQPCATTALPKVIWKKDKEGTPTSSNTEYSNKRLFNNTLNERKNKLFDRKEQQSFIPVMSELIEEEEEENEDIKSTSSETEINNESSMEDMLPIKRSFESFRRQEQPGPTTALPKVIRKYDKEGTPTSSSTEYSNKRSFNNTLNERKNKLFDRKEQQSFVPVMSELIEEEEEENEDIKSTSSEPEINNESLCKDMQPIERSFESFRRQAQPGSLQITARLGKRGLSRVKSPIVTRRSNSEKSSYIYLSGTYESSTTSLSSRSNESFQPTLSKVFEKETAVWSRKSTDSAQISSFEKIQQPSNCLECNQSETNCKTTSINRVEKLQEEDQNNATTAANGKFQKRFNENESSIYYSTKNASVDPLTTSSIAMQEIIEEEEEEEEDTTFPPEREFKNDGFYEHTSIRENKTVTIQEQPCATTALPKVIWKKDKEGTPTSSNTEYSNKRLFNNTLNERKNKLFDRKEQQSFIPVMSELIEEEEEEENEDIKSTSSETEINNESSMEDMLPIKRSFESFRRQEQPGPTTALPKVIRKYDKEGTPTSSSTEYSNKRSFNNTLNERKNKLFDRKEQQSFVPVMSELIEEEEEENEDIKSTSSEPEINNESLCKDIQPIERSFESFRRQEQPGCITAIPQ